MKTNRARNKKARAQGRNAARAALNASTRAAAGIEPATAPKVRREQVRHVTGLTWLMTRKKDGKPAPRLTETMYQTGLLYGEVCSEALRVQLPAKAGLGGGGFGSVTPSRAVFVAIRSKTEADRLLKEPFARDVGESLVELMERVCHRGETLSAIAGGDRLEAVVLEERLKVGLRLLHVLADRIAACCPKQLTPLDF